MILLIQPLLAPLLQIPYSMQFLAVLPQTSITVLAILLLLLLMLSFIISGAEVALFSLPGADINAMKTKKMESAQRVVRMLESPRLLLASLTVANIFVNLLIVILSNILLNEWLSDSAAGFLLILLAKIAGITLMLMLFGEFLPRFWAGQDKFRFASTYAPVIMAVHYVFKGIGAWTFRFSERIQHTLGSDKPQVYTSEQIDHAINMSSPEDATEEEKNILKGVINFGNITVRQIMRSRLDVHGIEVSSSFEDLVMKVEELHYSRLPVYQASLDQVTGIIHTKDLIPHLDEGPDYDWKHLVRHPYFVHENRLIEDLLHEFQAKRIHFAVVVDEFGGTEGIVTLEDIMEEVIGDIRDEYDEDEVNVVKIDDHTYVFEGKTLISEASKQMRLPADTFENVQGESETLAGLMMELAGEIPKKDQEIPAGDFLFTVMEIEKNRILKVRVEIKPISEM